MGRKQLKIALSEDFYLELRRKAAKHNIPVSTFARSLITAGLAEANTKPPAETVKPHPDELITLSEVLAEDSEQRGLSAGSKSSTTKLINPTDKTPVNIQIIFNS